MIKTFEALASGETLELRMYGPIGGGMFRDGVSAEAVSQALKDSPNCKSILVRMSSPGGAAFEGMAIRSMLSGHPAKVTCEVEGLAASAASIIAMGADHIRMHEGSAMMIHEASTFTGGDIQEHERAIAALTSLNDGMGSIYSTRTGMDKKACLKLMAAETWLTPDQAVEKKFADEVVKGKAPTTVPTAFDLTPFHYRHAPPQFHASSDLTPEELEATRPQPRKQVTASAAQLVLPPPPEKQTMSFARIATALGLDSSAEEAAVMSALDKMKVRVVAADERATAAEAPLAELRTLTAATTIEGVIGAVRGYAESAKQLPEIKAQLEAQTKSLEEQKRAALFAADASDKAGRKLTPAMVTFWTVRPVAELEAFLAVAPHVVVTQASAKSQPAVKTGGAAATGGGTEIVTHEGKSWEQMAPAEKHNLHVDAPDTYEALRANHAERGSPRAQPKQERASA